MAVNRKLEERLFREVLGWAVLDADNWWNSTTYPVAEWSDLTESFVIWHDKRGSKRSFKPSERVEDALEVAHFFAEQYELTVYLSVGPGEGGWLAEIGTETDEGDLNIMAHVHCESGALALCNVMAEAIDYLLELSEEKGKCSYLN